VSLQTPNTLVSVYSLLGVSVNKLELEGFKGKAHGYSKKALELCNNTLDKMDKTLMQLYAIDMTV